MFIDTVLRERNIKIHVISNCECSNKSMLFLLLSHDCSLLLCLLFPTTVAGTWSASRNSGSRLKEFGIDICCRFIQGLHCINVYTELYQTILQCAILHYTTLCYTVSCHVCTWMQCYLWLGWQKRLWQSDLTSYYCNLNKSASSSNSFDVYPLYILSPLRD
jgi:hypothetical protein